MFPRRAIEGTGRRAHGFIGTRQDSIGRGPAAYCPHTGYLLDNAGREAPARFAALSALFDSTTIRHLSERGVARGWRCLEVGAGGGSIANWLADHVGETGSVLATDIDPHFLEPLRRANLEVLRHDVAVDPLPESAFDLVHARLVLLHLPKREMALARMIAALKPGGWLLAEEYDTTSMPPDPAHFPAEVRLKTQVALTRLLEDSGVNRSYGRVLFGQLRSHGLVSVDAEGRILMLQHGTHGASMLQANYEQLRGAMIDGGYITPQQFQRDVARLQGFDFVMPSAILWSAWGRRPLRLEPQRPEAV
jgi:SAM-dependent methyltransferase